MSNIIWFVDNDAAKNAQALDDKTLDKQVETIAQTLCNVHHLYYQDLQDCKISGMGFNKKQIHDKYEDVPLKTKMPIRDCLYSKWVSECLANYLKLVDIGHEACQEWHYRFSDKCTADMQSWEEQNDCGAHHEMKYVIEWARHSVPDLPRKLEFIKADFYGNSVLGAEEEPTPFPLVMKGKYIDYYSEMNHVMKSILKIDIIESYRNYYRAQLEKKLKNHICEPETYADAVVYGAVCKKIKWTRRIKPIWI